MHTSYLSPSVFRRAEETRRIEIHQSQLINMTFWTCGLFAQSWHETNAGLQRLWLAHLKKHTERWIFEWQAEHLSLGYVGSLRV